MSERIIGSLLPTVREAGEILTSAHLSEGQIYRKTGEANFVTSYDIEIQRLLITEILEIVPDAVFFGEEDTESNSQVISDTGYTFFIDPIDGTTNFLFDYYHSCISIGIAKNGKMDAGIVYNPYTDQMYTAVKGMGSFCNGKRLVIEDKCLKEGIAAFGCARYNENGTNLLFEVVKELFYQSIAIRNGGSSTLDLCRIATGSNVLYLEMLLQPYDYAAASVILEEAGGVILQIDGSEITLDRGCSILAGTMKSIDECKRLFGKEGIYMKLKCSKCGKRD